MDRIYGGAYGTRYIVEILVDGAWVPYSRDRKIRDEASANRLLTRLQDGHPDWRMRVVSTETTRA
jgi:hypothetical protein